MDGHLEPGRLLEPRGERREPRVGDPAEARRGGLHGGAREAVEGDPEERGPRADLARALRHVSVVRYDAYGDLAGRYSFSAALLDDSGDGLIITSIHGRNENRLYLKGIAQGNPDIELSPEEEQAVVAAKGDGR